jgi:hypothetical protein
MTEGSSILSVLRAFVVNFTYRLRATGNWDWQGNVVAKQRVLVVGGGLAGLAATMQMAELGLAVDCMSLTPVKRSHSVCAQGGINSVNDLTR